jgi:hypothetical protein
MWPFVETSPRLCTISPGLLRTQMWPSPCFRALAGLMTLCERFPLDCRGDCVTGQLVMHDARFDAGYYGLNAIYGGEAASRFTCSDANVSTSQSFKLAARCWRVSTAAL